MTFQRVKGTTDYYPSEWAIRQAIMQTLSEQAKNYGFLEVSTPVFETTELLTAKSGEEVKQQLFVMQQKGSEDIALRFDLTVPMTRLFVSKQKELQKPVKWFSIDRMWRYEAPQAGRLREFYQLSVELFGSEYPEADANCINLIISCLNAFGLTDNDFALRINNRKLLEGLLLEVTTKEKLPSVMRIIDKVSKITDVQFFEELRELGLSAQQIETVRKITRCKGDFSILSSIRTELTLNELATNGLEELERVLALVNPAYVVVDLSIARGLEYYTGNVYECFDKQGKYRALAGGGRYDELVSLFGGLPTPATGFAIGLETLSLLLDDKKLLPDTALGPEYYIAPVNEAMLPKALAIAAQLRKKARVDIDLLRRKLSKQFEYADAIGALKVVIVGEKDIAQGVVTVRDLKSGKEEKVNVDEV